MADSTHYDPLVAVTPPVGMLPVLGKVRAEIDKIRASSANDRNMVFNRNAAQDDASLKAEAEIQLLDQKSATELAQTSNTIPADIGIDSETGPRTIFDHTTDPDTVTGVVGEQRALFYQQKEGFIRDAEQKLSKMMIDTWSIRASTDIADAAAAGVADTEISKILDAAKIGIGELGAPEVTTPNPPASNLKAESGSGQVSVSWDLVDNATSYNVYIAEATGVDIDAPATYDQKYTAIPNPFIHTQDANGPVDPLHTYYYVVTAVNSATVPESVASDEVNASPT